MVNVISWLFTQIYAEMCVFYAQIDQYILYDSQLVFDTYNS